MQIEVSKHVSSLFTRLLEHLRIPLFRNGYALITSSLLTSSIGMIYWILAARIYPTNIIGLNSALISSMMLLGGIAQLNLANAHIRFIPAAGSSTRRLVGITYLIGPAIALMATLIFVLRSEDWLPALGFLRSSPWLAIALIVATMVYSIFILEDGVLTGLRRATWVPVENAFFGLVKIALLLLFVSSLPLLGVFASWLVSLGIIVVPTTYFIFQKLIPEHQRSNPVKNTLPHLPEITRYVAGDYIASLSWMGCTSLIPILVTQISGPTANAYYYLSWQIAIIVYSICTSLGSSLVVEASMNPGQLRHLSRRVFFQLAILVIPTALVLIIGAPVILQLFGNIYAQQGAMLLRLLSISAVPYIVITVYVSIARVQRKIYKAVTAYLSSAILVVGMSVFFLHRIGLLGVGYAWITGLSIVAAVILAGWLRNSILQNQASAGPAQQNAGFEWKNGPKPLSMARYFFEERKRSSQDQGRNRIVDQVWPEIRMDLEHSGTASDSGWEVKRYIRTETDRAVAIVGPPGNPPIAVVKIYLSDRALASAERQQAAIKQISAIAETADLIPLIPMKLMQGQAAGWTYLVERYLPGIDGRRILANPIESLQMQINAVDAILELHRATVNLKRVDANLLEDWVDKPARILSFSAGRWLGNRRWTNAIRVISEELKESLADQTINTSWVHGDFMPGNLLYSPEQRRLTGIIDWELSHPDGLPVLDVYQLLLGSRHESTGIEFGPLLLDMIAAPKWAQPEKDLLLRYESGIGIDSPDVRTLLLLFWLQHIASNLEKSANYAAHWIWISRNILPVLNRFSKPSVVAPAIKG